MTDLVTLSLREEPPGISVLQAVGEIDMSNCHELDLALDRLDGEAHVVVDMSLCTYFDSSCLAVLTRHARLLRDEGRDFNVRADQNGRRVISIASLGELLGLEGEDSAN